MPRICEPSDDALPLQAIDQDMEDVAKQRWPSAQPWHPRTVRIENREWVRQRSEVWKPRTKKGKTANEMAAGPPRRDLHAGELRPPRKRPRR